ncbi:hypothetical protein SUDANB121_05458 [Nocardiopsis dassonvillei]|uniref:hypothetical protein n=1 Tax=Nocardiopsis dassonvillei TaxID=2014 RepID=UPI003F5484DD
MRTLRAVLIRLGFFCLLPSAVPVPALADAATSSTPASPGLYSVPFPVVSALVGTGLLVGANTLGRSLAAPQAPSAPGDQAPVPQPYAQPRHQSPRAPAPGGRCRV